jgi:hypothetical protein
MSTVTRLSSENCMPDGKTVRTNFTPPNTDAFNRQRFSVPVLQFGYQNQYNKGDRIWAEKTSGTGTATHEPNSATVMLNTGTASGDLMVRQTRKYFRYSPFESLANVVTFAMIKHQNRIRKRAGYFDADNGVYFEQSNGDHYVVLRSKSSGAVVERRIPRKDWTNQLENVDLCKSLIFFMDTQWLGVGTVAVGFEIDREPFYVYFFHNAGIVDSTYMTTANLPIRYEIENTGATDEVGVFRQICSAVATEAGAVDDKSYYTFSANNGITPVSVTTRRAVISIRPKATFNSIVNRGQIIPDTFDVTTASQNILWEIVYGATIGGTPAWNSANDDSITEFDVAGTTITGGIVIASGYLNAGGGAARTRLGEALNNALPLTLDIDGANPIPLSLVATAFTGTATVTAAFNWREVY